MELRESCFCAYKAKLSYFVVGLYRQKIKIGKGREAYFELKKFRNSLKKRY